jgi:hypothetical protein
MFSVCFLHLQQSSGLRTANRCDPGAASEFGRPTLFAGGKLPHIQGAGRLHALGRDTTSRTDADMAKPDHDEMLKRSVDSLQRLYAVVVGLAVTICIQQALSGSDGKLHTWVDAKANADFLSSLFWPKLPIVLSFVASIVPFFHGMNRHLDRVYLEETVSPAKEGFIVLDFFIFFFESCLLVGLASLVNTGDNFFVALGLLLVIDCLWAFISHGVHYGRLAMPTTLWWGVINVVALIVLLVILYSNAFQEGWKRTWALAGVACIRTAVDYIVCWRFYIPAVPSKSKARSSA